MGTHLSFCHEHDRCYSVNNILTTKMSNRARSAIVKSNYTQGITEKQIKTDNMIIAIIYMNPTGNR